MAAVAGSKMTRGYKNEIDQWRQMDGSVPIKLETKRFRPGRIKISASAQRPIAIFKHTLSANKGIDNISTLAYVPHEFQMFLQAPVAQPG